MANLQSVSAATENVVPDQFPAGPRILVVDDDVTFLKVIEQMSIRCHYQVTTCSEAPVALNLLREKKDCFDVILSDVQMPDMDGYKFLELVGQEMNLPVIMMSVDGTSSAVMKGIQHGACHYLIKPVREEDLRNIWQHVVVRRNWNENKEHENLGSLEDNNDDQNKRGNDDSEYAASSVHDATEGIVKAPKKRSRLKEGGVVELANDDPSTTKKPRVVWSVELHQQFVSAVMQLGLDKAVPKRILELMNVPGLTRENVASHLQKFRLYLKRRNEVAQQHNGKPNTVSGTMESKLGAYGKFDIQALAAAGHVPHEIGPAGNLMLKEDQTALLKSSIKGLNHSHAEHAVAYGQPLVKCPSKIAEDFPHSIITVHDASSGYGAWAWPPSSNTIGSVGLNRSIGRLAVQNNNAVMDILQHQQRQEHQQKQQQLQHQLLMHHQIYPINVHPSCLVFPSQPSGTLHEGNSPAYVNHNCSFGRNALIDYSIFSPQFNNSLNIGQFPGENTQTRGFRCGYTIPSSIIQQLQNPALTCAVRPFPGLSLVSDTQVSYVSRSTDSLHQPSLKNLGFDGKDACIPSRLAGLEIESSVNGLSQGKSP